jgi:hypothetical protein
MTVAVPQSLAVKTARGFCLDGFKISAAGGVPLACGAMQIETIWSFAETTS